MTWSADQRNQLVNHISRLSKSLSGREREGFDEEQLDAMEIEEEQLLEEYIENLPYVTVSRCPICTELLELPVDLGGLDGPWWWESCPVDLPKAVSCEHFRVFLGAVNLHGRTPSEVFDGVSPGPGVPFVVARLIEEHSALAVISSFDLAPGDTCYLIAYFSEEEIDPTDLHQEWRHEFYSILDEDGQPAFSEMKLDPWDFDIDRWIEDGAAFWIGKGDGEFQLHQSVPTPYSNIDGTRSSQVISGGELELQEPPSGGESSLYEPAT